MRYLLKTFLTIALVFNLLLPAAVLADNKTEYQQCLDGCYDSGADWTQEQISGCIHQCSITYPNGAAEWGQSTPSDTTVNIGSTKTIDQDSGASFTFTPNVAIGGLFTAGAKIPVNADLLPSYINTWYALLLGTVGILATIMVMWGGFKWLLARGDGGKITDAKSIIFSALAGLALALLSYTLISIINPNLTVITGQEFEPVILAGNAGISTETQQNNLKNQGKQIAPDKNDPCLSAPNGTAWDYKKDGVNKPMTCSNCDAYDSQIKAAAAAEGVDPKLLKAIMSQESSGNANVGTSKSNACGIMQILPTTASGLAGRKVSCDELKGQAGVDLSIKLAAKYVKNSNEKDLTRAAAAYNGGKGAVSNSTNCKGYLSYQCCQNAGYGQTRDYVNKVMNYYNGNSTP
ncbi:MAG: transglycosylase SLT domain-containing protein [Candidatus Buchananbacteria bacterium]